MPRAVGRSEMKDTLKVLNVEACEVGVEEVQGWFRDLGVDGVKVVNEYWEPSLTDVVE